MKMKASTGKKLKYGVTSVSLTALIIAVVIIVNVICSLLVTRFNIYGDLTPELHFTISEECFNIIGEGEGSPIDKLDQFREENKKYNEDNSLTFVEGDDEANKESGAKDENVMINIIFALEKDILEGQEITKYVVQNAEELRAKFPDHIDVKYIDHVKNPSAFRKYLNSSVDMIDQESVVIECGTQFRVRTLQSFYILKNDEPYAYNAEKAFASSILAVTRDETPVVCYTTNHGEKLPESSQNDVETGEALIPFKILIEDAGYEVRPIDLSKEEIPDECKILLVFDPKKDFMTSRDDSEVDELKKLDAFLDDRNSLMVFMSPEEKGQMANLEEFLAEWGLAFKYDDDKPYIIEDSQNSIFGDSQAVVGTYSQSPLSKDWTEDMKTEGRELPKVVFSDARPITRPNNGYELVTETLEDDPNTKYTVSFSRAYNRVVYDMFTTSSSASMSSGNSTLYATSQDPFRLMAVSVEEHTENEYSNQLYDNAYVMLCGSTNFAMDYFLTTNTFGNYELMLSVLRLSGREPVAVGLAYKEFANFSIESITNKQATTYTVIFTTVPAVLSLIAGVVVIVRRKYR